MNVLKIKNEHDLMYSYNTTIKTYANGEQHLKHYSYNTLKGVVKKENVSKIKTKEEIEKSRERQKYKNLYKTKTNLIDLAYHNSLIEPWEYFVTLTFDNEKVNSFDYKETSEALAKWLDNMKHQNPNMAYLMTPELHKSGRIHFHGIFKNVSKWALNEARSPHTNRLIKKNGVQIYNLENYKFGYTTVSKINNQEAVSVYMSKYMTKELLDIKNKKRYWCSKNLERPTIEYADFNEDYLQFYIDINKVKEIKEIQKENSKIVFLKTLS